MLFLSRFGLGYILISYCLIMRWEFTLFMTFAGFLMLQMKIQRIKISIMIISFQML